MSRTAMLGFLAMLLLAGARILGTGLTFSNRVETIAVHPSLTRTGTVLDTTIRDLTGVETRVFNLTKGISYVWSFNVTQGGMAIHLTDRRASQWSLAVFSDGTVTAQGVIGIGRLGSHPSAIVFSWSPGTTGVYQLSVENLNTFPTGTQPYSSSCDIRITEWHPTTLLNA